jgi:hypothetical protein
MSVPEPRNIDWGSAEIEDGALTVELTGTGSKHVDEAAQADRQMAATFRGFAGESS